MRYILVLALILSGCAFVRTTDAKINGTNIKSVYATGDANIEYHSVTKWMFWKQDPK